MKWLPLVIVAVLPGFVAAAPGQATAVVAGIVLSPEGRPLPRALVAVTGTTRGDQADENGRFLITEVPSGARVVRATRTGYREATYRVELVADDTVRIALRLNPAMPEDGMPIWPIDPDARPRAIPISSSRGSPHEN